MKKFNKIMTVLMLVIATFAFVAPVFGVTFDPDSWDSEIKGQDADPNVTGVVGRVWGTVILIVQVLAVAAVVFAGLRYMFASADAKADIKKQTVILVVGAVLVFGATFIIDLIATVTETTVTGN